MKIYIHSQTISIIPKEDTNKSLPAEYRETPNRQFLLQSAAALLTNRGKTNYMVHLSFLGIWAIS